MERLHILDGHGYIFRAFFGMARGREKGAGMKLSTSSGMPTAALHVFASMMIRLHREVKPERIAVVFDAPGRTFRKEIDDNYKATRRETPEDLIPQLPYFPRLTEAFRWPILSVPGVEADDVIATLVGKARARGWEARVYSGDKDLMQLVDDHVTVIDSMRQQIYDAAGVEAKFGVPPAKLRDYLALVGDTSDNVPGMPGIGKKTAAKLLAAYQTIEGILAHVDQLKGKQKKNFEDPALLEQLERSRLLVTLKSDVELGVELDELQVKPWDPAGVEELFYELEFEALLSRLGAVVDARPRPNKSEAGSSGRDADDMEEEEEEKDDDDEPESEPVEIPEPIVAAEAEKLAALIRAARAEKTMAVQVESDGSRPDRAWVVGISLAARTAAPVYIPLAHRYLGAPRLDPLPDELVALFGDAEIRKICHDLKSVKRGLLTLGIAAAGLAGDTMLAQYLLDPDHSPAIDRVLKTAVGVEVPSRKSLLGKGKSKIPYEELQVERAAEHSARATHALLFAHDRLERRLERRKLSGLLHDLELPLAHLLADIERIGICLDTDYLQKLSDQVSGQIAALEGEVFRLAGTEINIGSPKQLSQLLFEQLGLKAGRMRKTKTGGYSTDHEVLESLRDAHEIIAPIIEHRELVKLKGTYLDALPPLVNPATGRIHTSFDQAVAATGRLSSHDPNLQNIPVRTELGRQIRRAFVAGEGKTLVSVDYSQIELRILAHLSKDPVLLRAFRDDIDVHSQTAAEVFDMPLDQIGPEERRVAKAVNYGLVYGQSQFGLAKSLGIPQHEAKKYIRRYFERFSTVRSFMHRLVRDAARIGYVTTVMGRRRPLPNLTSRNYQLRQQAERMAKNAPVQGSAADIMKRAMLDVAARLGRESFDAQMLLTVHDELVFEVAPEQAEDLAAVVAAEMEGAYRLDVPLKAAVGIADNWADAH